MLILTAIFGFTAAICAGKGEWGPFAVSLVIALLTLAMSIAGSEEDRAINNAEEYWANGGRQRMVQRRPTRRQREEARRREEERKSRQKADHVCGYCGMHVFALAREFQAADGKWEMYVCPSCGQRNLKKLN